VSNQEENMTQDARELPVITRSSVLSNLIDAACVTGALAAEALTPRTAAPPLAIALITVYLAWSLGPYVLLYFRTGGSRS
jgi:hypothetical protein